MTNPEMRPSDIWRRRRVLPLVVIVAAVLAGQIALLAYIAAEDRLAADRDMLGGIVQEFRR